MPHCLSVCLIWLRHNAASSICPTCVYIGIIPMGRVREELAESRKLAEMVQHVLEKFPDEGIDHVEHLLKEGEGSADRVAELLCGSTVDLVVHNMGDLVCTVTANSMWDLAKVTHAIEKAANIPAQEQLLFVGADTLSSLAPLVNFHKAGAIDLTLVRRQVMERPDQSMATTVVFGKSCIPTT